MTAKLGKEGDCAAPEAMVEALAKSGFCIRCDKPGCAVCAKTWQAAAWFLERRFKRPVPPHTASDF